MKWETSGGFWVEQWYDRTYTLTGSRTLDAVLRTARVETRRSLEINRVSDGGTEKGDSSVVVRPSPPEHRKRRSWCSDTGKAAEE